MKLFHKLAILCGAGLGLAGCVTTQEMPLAQNIVRLDTQASGALFTGQATSQTMRRAAELTIQRGYTHFRFEQASISQGSQFVGIQSHGSGYATGYGNSATAYGSIFSSPVYAPTANVGVTVVMFRAGEKGARGAFDAAEVLRRANG